MKEGGLACMIGPVHPTFWLSRLFADAWMLFPTEQEYMDVRPRAINSLVVSSCMWLLGQAGRPSDREIWAPVCASRFKLARTAGRGQRCRAAQRKLPEPCYQQAYNIWRGQCLMLHSKS